MQYVPISQCIGEPCRACGLTIRYIATGKCVSCFRRQQLEHYHRPITPVDEKAIIAAFKSGESVFEICRKTHRAAEPVKSFLVDQGFLPRHVLGRTVSTCSKGKRALVYDGQKTRKGKR